MVSKLTLDRSDPDVDSLVSGWKVGGEYIVTLNIRQTAADPKMASFDVLSVQSEEAEPEEPAPAPAAKQSIPISYRK